MGRARRHRPVCWSELATRQVHEDARSAQQAAALGTSSSGPHHEPPRMVSACSARSGGDQEKPSTGRSHTRSSPTPRLPVPRQPPQPLHSLKTSPAAVHRSGARSTSTPLPATGSSTCWTSGRQNDDGTCGGACARSSGCAPECSTASTRTLPTAGSGARYEQRRAAGRLCCHPQT